MGFSSGPSRGLAALIGYEDSSSNQGKLKSLKDTVAHILDVDRDALSDPDVFAGAENVLHARDEEVSSRTRDSASSCEGSSSSSGSTAPPSISGVLGPPRVTIDRSSSHGQLQFSPNDLAAESLTNFSSFRATACVHAGRFMYEATIQTAWQPGIQQVRQRRGGGRSSRLLRCMGGAKAVHEEILQRPPPRSLTGVWFSDWHVVRIDRLCRSDGPQSSAPLRQRRASGTHLIATPTVGNTQISNMRAYLPCQADP